MPLCTAIINEGTTIARKVRWSWWHVECMTEVARREGDMSADTPILEVWSINGGHHTVESGVCFKDPYDGEVLTLNSGDLLEVWREW